LSSCRGAGEDKLSLGDVVRLYRAKVEEIAKQAIELLITDGDIEVEPEKVPEAELDLVAIMEEYLRQDSEFRGRIKDEMARRNIPYNEYGRVRSRLAEEANHPLNDDVERFLTRQFIENLLISPFVEEVYSEDDEIHKKIIELLRGHHVNEDDIREAARERIKNVREGTVDYEIELQKAVREEKKRRGLIKERKRPPGQR